MKSAGNRAMLHLIGVNPHTHPILAAQTFVPAPASEKALLCDSLGLRSRETFQCFSPLLPQGRDNSHGIGRGELYFTRLEVKQMSASVSGLETGRHSSPS